MARFEYGLSSKAIHTSFPRLTLKSIHALHIHRNMNLERKVGRRAERAVPISRDAPSLPPPPQIMWAFPTNTRRPTTCAVIYRTYSPILYNCHIKRIKKV